MQEGLSLIKLELLCTFNALSCSEENQFFWNSSKCRPNVTQGHIDLDLQKAEGFGSRTNNTCLRRIYWK